MKLTAKIEEHLAGLVHEQLDPPIPTVFFESFSRGSFWHVEPTVGLINILKIRFKTYPTIDSDVLNKARVQPNYSFQQNFNNNNSSTTYSSPNGSTPGGGSSPSRASSAPQSTPPRCWTSSTSPSTSSPTGSGKHTFV